MKSRLHFFVTALLVVLICYTTSAMAECPTVARPGALVTRWPQQLELDEFERQAGPLEFRENPAFAAKVTAGELPPVTDRLPQELFILKLVSGPVDRKSQNQKPARQGLRRGVILSAAKPSLTLYPALNYDGVLAGTNTVPLPGLATGDPISFASPNSNPKMAAHIRRLT